MLTAPELPLRINFCYARDVMVNIEELKRHYFFTKKDEDNLKSIGDMVSPYADPFASDFYDYLSQFPEAMKFFRSQQAIQKRKETITRWMTMLFSGKYDNRYLAELRQIGLAHVKKEIPIHLVAASMNFKRQYLIDILGREVEDEHELHKLTKSLEKILDINLDVMTSSYHEEEIKSMFLTKKMDTALIVFAERFSYGLNLVLVLALIGLSIGVILLFATDIYTLFFTRQLEKGILSSLGTLLVVWVIVELIQTEIKYLRGERFHIEVFVSVALVAIIRELLVSTLTHESTQKILIFLAAILVLGVVYYLISRTDLPN